MSPMMYGRIFILLSFAVFYTKVRDFLKDCLKLGWYIKDKFNHKGVSKHHRLLSDRQIAKRDRIAGKIGQEQLQEQLCIISDMSSVINQFKAGVDKELAIDKLEEDVKKIWQLLKL